MDMKSKLEEVTSKNAGDIMVGDLITQPSLSYYTDDDLNEMQGAAQTHSRRWTVAERAKATFLGTAGRQQTTHQMLKKELTECHEDLEAFLQGGGVNYFVVCAKALLAITVLCAYSAEPILFYFAKAEGTESYAFSVSSVFCVSTAVIALGTWALDGFRTEFWSHFTFKDLCIFAVVRFLGSLAHIIRPLSLVYLGVGPFVVISSLQVVANAALHYIVEGHAISTNQGVSIFILLMALIAFQGSDFAAGGDSFLWGFFLLCCGLVGLGLAHVFGERYLKEVFAHYDFTDLEKLCVTNTFDLISYIAIMFIMDWDIIKTGVFTGWTLATWLVTIDYILIFLCGIMTLMYLSAVIYALIITGAVAFSYLGDIFVFGKPLQLDHLFMMIVIVSLVIAYQIDGATQYYIEHQLHHAELEARESEAKDILMQYMNLNLNRKKGPVNRRHIHIHGAPTTCFGNNSKPAESAGAGAKKDYIPIPDPKNA